jgi:hypothetical protein
MKAIQINRLVSSIIGAALYVIAAATMANATTIIDATGDGSGGPDIISVTGTYDANNLYLSVRFAPTSFDPSGTASGVLIGLNTDLNTSTGCCTDSSTFFPLGAEYSLFYTHSNGSSFVLSNLSSGASVFVANVTPTFVTDGFDLSVPLSLIGGNGLLQFGAVTGTDTGGSFSPLDYLVDDVVNHGPTSAAARPRSKSIGRCSSTC